MLRRFAAWLVDWAAGRWVFDAIRGRLRRSIDPLVEGQRTRAFGDIIKARAEFEAEERRLP